MTSQEMRDRGYFDLFGDIYRFLQNSDTNNWNLVVNDADAICNKYRNTNLSSLSSELVFDIVKELERR